MNQEYAADSPVSAQDWAALERQYYAQQRKSMPLAEAERRLRLKELTLDPSTLDGAAVPERRWLVPQLIPRGAVTLLSGDGGVGKSLLAMQLMTAGALAARPQGETWLGIAAAPFASVGFFCEDDGEELHRRQEAINAHYGCRFADLGAMRWMLRAGEDNVMLQYGWDGNAPPQVRDAFDALEEIVRAHRAELIVIDTLADVFGGNENDRAQVRSFIGRLRALAQINDGAVLLMAHPSVAGMSTGTGLSGSTAWNNSVRSRLYLTRARSGDGEGDPDLRELRAMKSNYAASGAKLPLRWQAGVFVREAGGGHDAVSAIERRNLARRFAELVAIAQSRAVPLSPWPSSTYAPTMIKNMLPEAARLTKEALASAMRDAIAFDLVRVIEEKRGKGMRSRLVPNEDATTPDE